MNFSEELLFEYYEFKGYHVKRNIKIGKKNKGGYGGEIDIAAYSLKRNHLLQILPSMDTQNWVDRESRYMKKFCSH